MAIDPIGPDLTRKAFRDGDVLAYTRLVRLLEPPLRRHAVRLLRSGTRSDVDDLLQETFEHLHRAAVGMDVERGVEAWAFVIMRNLCVDWHRAAVRRPPTAPPIDEDAETGRPGHSHGDGDRALLLDLRDALMRLPLDRRRLIELVYFNGFPLSEAATRLKITYPAARYQLEAAFKQLRLAPGLQGLEKTRLATNKQDRDTK